MTGEPHMFIVNTGDVLDEVDRLVDEDIQRCHARLDWLRWVAILGPLLGFLGTIQAQYQLCHWFAPWMSAPYGCYSGGDEVFDAMYSSFICTAAGIAFVILLIPTHHVSRNKATLLLLKTRDAIKTMFLRTRPFREIGRPIVRAGAPGGRERLQRYIAKGLRIRLPSLAPAITVFLAWASLFFCFSDFWGLCQALPAVQLPIAQPVGEVDVRDDEPNRVTLTLRHLQREEMPCAPSDDPTNCRDETHWQISAFRYDACDYSDPDRLYGLLGSSLGQAPPGSSIFLRADAAAPFGLVQRVIEACRQAGIEKVEFGVASPQSLSR